MGKTLSNPISFFKEHLSGHFSHYWHNRGYLAIPSDAQEGWDDIFYIFDTIENIIVTIIPGAQEFRVLQFVIVPVIEKIGKWMSGKSLNSVDYSEVALSGGNAGLEGAGFFKQVFSNYKKVAESKIGQKIIESALSQADRHYLKSDFNELETGFRRFNAPEVFPSGNFIKIKLSFTPKGPEKFVKVDEEMKVIDRHNKKHSIFWNKFESKFERCEDFDLTSNLKIARDFGIHAHFHSLEQLNKLAQEKKIFLLQREPLNIKS